MLDKANRILALFSLERSEMSARDIARRLGRPRSSVYRILGQLTKAGFLDQDAGTGNFRVGIYLASLGEIARHSTSLQRVAYPHLLRLSKESGGEEVVLMVRNGSEGVTVDVVEGFHPIRIPYHLGGRFPLHATAGGRVFLAAAPAAELDQALKPPLEKCTPKTVTDPTRLKKIVEVTRKRGYGLTLGEWIEDVNAVAFPIRDHRAQVVAAIAVAMPSARWHGGSLRKFASVGLKEAGLLSAALGYRAGARRGNAKVRR